MTRKMLCFIAGLLSCVAVAAQDQAPAPEATAKPGITSTAPPEVQTFQKIEDKWDDAVNARDQYALELVLSPVFVGISATGDITTRNQELAGVISGQDKIDHLDQRVITVRMLGDIAVANGTYKLHRKGSSGSVDEKGVFTHVFEKQRNSWICVNSQRTILREDGPPGKSKKKQGNGAEQPFHIPLISK
ncbi:nuclear transport factor 2 family protein [Occallatibacter riparius]|uniref:Nuclear transport factor 2 family protein n=1 Tax=Occallatibacter riparius TaxID=1002689 RepID=A0A9J7BUY6_9BACT|nr:nuclear transport factor 2 family protein [Occallatibacter riparius]UWZ86479.1 nuclear transport factor 2 family protein [Occallatibacter riparius]